jgi:hypothetical protein
MKWWRNAFASLVGVLLCQSVFALGVEPLLLSPGLTLATLQERIGRMECQRGQDEGGQDCFIALPLQGVVNVTRQAGDVFVFLRARQGRVGQMVINGPAERLSNVFGTLLRHYGAPQQGVLRAASTLAPCTDLSQWQRFGHSVVVRVCRGQSGGAGDFVVNVLADWYVAAQASR